MPHHLLVPLDGTPIAETALTLAARLARRANAQLTVLHLVEDRPPASAHGHPHLTDRAAAQAYLDTVTRRPELVGLAVGTHVHEHSVAVVAAGLVDHAAELGADLVVMAVHGPHRWHLRGNVAEQVATRRAVGVLLLGPDTAVDRDPPFAQVLVPLDGEPAHEVSLASAQDLAAVCGAGINLFQAVPTIQSLPLHQAFFRTQLPAATRLALDLAEAEAHRYLADLAGRLAQNGLSVSTAVARGAADAAIAAEALRIGADLLVLSTHGRFGSAAFWEGSLAARMMDRVRIACLFVPAAAP